MKIVLLELHPGRYQALADRFSGVEGVTVVRGEFESFMETNDVQCVVSPANSFGLMDGGYDLAITRWYGPELQKRVQQYILEHYYGEQPVGTSFLVETGKTGKGKYLIHTPTMRVPERIIDCRVIYQCMRTTLMTAMEHNVESIVIPMFGGLNGQTEPAVCAEMMYAAFRQIQYPPKELTWDYAFRTHIKNVF